MSSIARQAVSSVGYCKASSIKSSIARLAVSSRLLQGKQYQVVYCKASSIKSFYCKASSIKSFYCKASSIKSFYCKASSIKSLLQGKQYQVVLLQGKQYQVVLLQGKQYQVVLLQGKQYQVVLLQGYGIKLSPIARRTVRPFPKRPSRTYWTLSGNHHHHFCDYQVETTSYYSLPTS